MASVATVNHIVMAMLLCTGPEMIGEMWSCRPYHYRIITRRAWATWFVDSIRTTSTKHVCKPGMFNSLRVQVISIPKKIPFIAFLLLLSLWYLPSASHMAKPRRLIHLYIFFCLVIVVNDAISSAQLFLYPSIFCVILFCVFYFTFLWRGMNFCCALFSRSVFTASGLLNTYNNNKNNNINNNMSKIFAMNVHYPFAAFNFFAVALLQHNTTYLNLHQSYLRSLIFFLFSVC